MEINNTKIEGYLSQIAKNDKNALEDLYYEIKDIIYAYALSKVNNRDDAGDIMQDTFIKVYNNCHNYKSEGKPLAWILTIARNQCYEKLRDTTKRNTVDLDNYQNHLVSEETDITGKILIDECLNSLTQEEREIVTLHALSGLKHREIAEILQLKTSTVLSKYSRAIKKLQERMVLDYE